MQTVSAKVAYYQLYRQTQTLLCMYDKQWNDYVELISIGNRSFISVLTRGKSRDISFAGAKVDKNGQMVWILNNIYYNNAVIVIQFQYISLISGVIN